MTDSDVSRILERMDGLRLELRGDMASLKADLERDQDQLRQNIAGVFDRLDKQASLGHEVRLREIEVWKRGFWGKAIGLIGVVNALFMALFQLLRGGK